MVTHLPGGLTGLGLGLASFSGELATDEGRGGEGVALEIYSDLVSPKSFSFSC
jgi:hypothetical protein